MHVIFSSAKFVKRCRLIQANFGLNAASVKKWAIALRNVKNKTGPITKKHVHLKSELCYIFLNSINKKNFCTNDIIKKNVMYNLQSANLSIMYKCRLLDMLLRISFDLKQSSFSRQLFLRIYFLGKLKHHYDRFGMPKISLEFKRHNNSQIQWENFFHQLSD